MKVNESKVDRFVRGGIAIGAAGLALGVASPMSAAQIGLFALAAIMAGTAAVGTCPIYSAVGISTCKKDAD